MSPLVDVVNGRPIEPTREEALFQIAELAISIGQRLQTRVEKLEAVLDAFKAEHPRVTWGTKVQRAMNALNEKP